MKNKFFISCFIISIITAGFCLLSGSTGDLNAAEKVIKIAAVAEPDTLDPSQTGMPPVSGAIFQNIFDTIIDFNPDGKQISTIASWKILQNGKIFEFTVKKNIKFSNGDPLTAKDIVFSWDRFAKLNRNFMMVKEYVDKVEAINNSTARFSLKAPNSLFASQIAAQLNIMSKTYFDRVGEKEFVEKPVGTGPYKLVKWLHGRSIELEINEGYWGTKPQIQRAIIDFAPSESTRIAMLKAGEVDLIQNTPWNNVKELVQAGFKKVTVASNPGIGIQFHLKNPNSPWYNPKVRQAIAYCVDRKAIVDKVFFGIPNLYPWIGPSELGYDPSLKIIPYDPGKAKKLMAEAGYENGFEMPLYYWVGGPISNIKSVADYVSTSLNQIKIKCKLQVVEGPAMMDMVRKWSGDAKANVVIVTTPGIADNPDPIIPLNMFLYGPNPMGLYQNKELDKIIEQGLITVNDAQRAKIIQKAFKIVDKDLPLIPVLSNVIVYMMKPNIDFRCIPYGAELLSISEMKIK